MLGSALGATARYLLSLAALHLPGAGFPWGTLAANVTGSLLIGFYATLTGSDGRLLVSPLARQFVMVGILGGFTTFSVFSLETLLLLLDGRTVAGSINLVASLILWVPAAWAGHVLAQRMNRLHVPPIGSDP